MRIGNIVVLLLFAWSATTKAEVKLAAIFTDNMVLQQQKQVPIWGWATAGKKVSVKTSWNEKSYETVANSKGQWRLKLATPQAGGSYDIHISDGNSITLQNVLIGEVWLCSGQSNMEMPMKGYPTQPIVGSTDAILESTNDQIRLYTVPRNPLLETAEDSKPSSWKAVNPSSVVNFSATAYFFGKRLHHILNVPIGLIHSAYGGSSIEAWMDAEWLKDVEGIQIPTAGDTPKDKNRTPTMLYNGMIHPIVGYGIRGMIWYQGESNYERAEQYELLFPRMVKEYRKLWNDAEMPFYFAQIAPFDYRSLPPFYTEEKYNSAYLREAQRKSLSQIPHSGMAVTLDLGEENCIHPSKKKEGGDRLALLALGDTYSVEGIIYRSPEYDKMEVKGSQAVLHFKEAPLGLTSFGKEMLNFEVAGDDKVFHPARAILQGKTVVVSSLRVTNPVAVRYAFKDFVVGDLFGVNGLPVASFRTDDW